ncbi:MAG: nitroreductase family protein [Nanoarchaeota archaeon]
MDLDKCIKERRSVRSYLEKEVEHEKIAKLIYSARYAPSSGNLQNWRFIIVKDSKKRNEIAIACLKQHWMAEAPVHIVVCNKVEDVKRFYGSKGEFIYSIHNCAAAIENLLLTAYSLKLGTCWVGAFDENAIKKILRIPNDIKVEAIITVGYPKDKEEPAERYNLDSITFFEEWGKYEKDRERINKFKLFKKLY